MHTWRARPSSVPARPRAVRARTPIVIAAGVNALGHLSAYGDAGQDKVDRPAFFDGQRLLALPGLGGKRGRAQAINDLAEVAGVADDAQHHSPPSSKPAARRSRSKA